MFFGLQYLLRLTNTNISVVLNKIRKPCQFVKPVIPQAHSMTTASIFSFSQKLNIYWKYHNENWAVALTFPCSLLERQTYFLCSWISYWFLQNKTKEKLSLAHYKWSVTTRFVKYSLQWTFQHLQSCLQFIFIMGNTILSLVQYGKAFCLWTYKALKIFRNSMTQLCLADIGSHLWFLASISGFVWKF